MALAASHGEPVLEVCQCERFLRGLEWSVVAKRCRVFLKVRTWSIITSFWFCLCGMIPHFWRTGLLMFSAMFSTITLSIDDDKGKECGHELRTFTDGSPSAFAIKLH